MIPVEGVWTRQPTEICGIDWDNPIVKELNAGGGLKIVVTHLNTTGVPINWVTGRALTPLNAASLSSVAMEEGGVGLNSPTLSSAGTGGAAWKTGLFPDPSWRTLLVVEKQRGTSSGVTQYGHGVHDGTRRFYSGQANGSDSTNLMGWGSGAVTFTRGVSLSAGPYEVLGLTADGTSANVSSVTVRAYEGGSQKATASLNWSGSSASREFYIGKRTQAGATENGTSEIGVNHDTHLVVVGAALSAQGHAEFARNPWQIFLFAEDLPIEVPPGVGGVSGSIAATNAGDTAAASGTPVVVGTIARTNGNDTSSAAGSPIVAGTIARANGNDTASAAGTTVLQGTVAATNAPDTCAASGSLGNNISGAIAATNAGDTAAASGTTTVVGTVARANASDTASASGTPVLVGAIAATNRPDAAALTGAAGSVTGTIGAAERPDGCSAAGISGNVVPRFGGFEMVGGVPTVSRKPLLRKILDERAEAKAVTLPNKEKRRKARLIETIAAKVAMADESGAETRFRALLDQWKALKPEQAGEQLRADDALHVFRALVAAQVQRLQDEDDEEAVALLML